MTFYFISFISRSLRSLRNKNNGAENAIAIENVAKIIIQKCLILKRLDSINIQINIALATKSKSKESDCEAGLLVASSANLIISNPGP